MSGVLRFWGVFVSELADGSIKMPQRDVQRGFIPYWDAVQFRFYKGVKVKQVNHDVLNLQLLI